MGSISKKYIKVNKNLYFNLIKRAGEPAARITLKVNEWRTIFAILKIFKKNKYKTDKAGCIPFNFKEYNRLFLAGRKGTPSDTAGGALDALKSRRFDLLFQEKKDQKREATTIKNSPLFGYSGNARETKKIELNESIFYSGIIDDYFKIPADFIERLARAAHKINGRLMVADLVMGLYAVCHCIKHRKHVTKPLNELAADIGLGYVLKARQRDRIITKLERSLKVIQEAEFIKAYSLKNDTVTLCFVLVQPQAEQSTN